GSTVSVQVNDSYDANSHTDLHSVPTRRSSDLVTLTGVGSANEGEAKGYSFTTSDPGADTFAVVSESCGANGTLSNAAFTSATGADRKSTTLNSSHTQISYAVLC